MTGNDSVQTPLPVTRLVPGGIAAEQSYSVVFCGSSSLLFAGFREIFQREPDLRIVGMVESPLLLSKMSLPDPGVVLMGESCWPGQPENTQPAALDPVLAMRTVQLVTSLQIQALSAALQLQCAGYVTLNDSIPEILEVVRQVGSGHRAISPSLRPHLHWEAGMNKYVLKVPGLSQSLSRRQIDVMTRIARGDSVKEIARDMHLSQKSVDSHKYRIMRKLGLHDRVQVTRLAIREGLLSP